MNELIALAGGWPTRFCHTLVREALKVFLEMVVPAGPALNSS